MKTRLIVLAALLLVGAPRVVSPQDSFDDFVRDQNQEFDRWKEEVTSEYEAFVRADSIAFSHFREEVEKKWATFEGSTKKDWVEYGSDQNTRTVVDFEKGEARVEVLVPAELAEADPDATLAELEKAVENLAKDRGKTMDYPVENERPQPLSSEPVLANQLQTGDGEQVTKGNADDFAREIVRTQEVTREEVVGKDGTHRVKTSVVVKLVPHHLRVRAEKYQPLVDELAEEFGLDKRLVFAIIHTESYFNPKAKSPVPAYGLMQLVPASGARDAYNFVYKKDEVVSPNYLYDPQNNIRLGCAYFRVLLSRYFDGIDKLDSRYYCAIGAYNTGAGNVSKAIVGRPRLKPAIRAVNKMSPEEVLEKLKRDLPYQETRDYIVRVLERMQYYEEWG